jgi:pyruvate/2-oxoglutarate dehydrogenase complex dihydrolipoamide dehydrogenase (E3) component
MTATPEILPKDEHNATLIANVHPPDWTNPEPAGRYNLVVIGAGTAGLITAAVAAGLRARVALIERHLMGGDCLNVGCVPSKGLIRASRIVAEARRSAEFGLGVPPGAEADFGAAMTRMRHIRARISAVDSAARFRDELGVDVFLGSARFLGPDAVEVAGRALRFRKAVVATGARAVAPPVAGLAEAGYLTNETLFELTERPRRFAVIGAGPIGCEMAQAFRRFGSEVFLLDRAPQVLPREDADAAEIVQNRLRVEGIQLELGCRLERVEVRDGEKILRIVCADGGSREIAVDEILVAVGRAPNVEGLGLEAAGVEVDARGGVVVDDRLRTRNRRIYAAGDVCMDWKFTHAADAAAKIAVQNALFFPSKKLSSLVMPWCTYTDPEVAHVGLYAHEAAARGIATDTFEVPLTEVDRAVADGEEDGFVKVHVKKGTDRILGATIVAAHAGEMISEVTLAIVGKLGLGTILNTIHPYPTQAEGIKRVAGAYTRTRATPRVMRLLEGWMALRR